MYPSIQSWEDDYKWVKENLPTLKEYEGTLGLVQITCFGAKHLYRYYGKGREALCIRPYEEGQDNANTESQALLDRAQNLIVEFDSSTSFLSLKFWKYPGIGQRST